MYTIPFARPVQKFLQLAVAVCAECLDACRMTAWIGCITTYLFEGMEKAPSARRKKLGPMRGVLPCRLPAERQWLPPRPRLPNGGQSRTAWLPSLAGRIDSKQSCRRSMCTAKPLRKKFRGRFSRSQTSETLQVCQCCEMHS